VAILLVVTAHAGVPFLSYGGAVGVTVFFTLSGFLITRICLRELDERGRLDFADFFVKRGARLGPALLVMLCGAVVIAWVYEHDAGSVAVRALAPLLYVANYVRAAGISIEPFDVTWSLAVEEQFYLVWPPVLLLLGRSASKRRFAVVVTLGAVVACAWHMAATQVMGVSWGYFLPDANAFALALGCALAAWCRVADVSGPVWTPVTCLVALAALPALYGPARDGPLVPAVQLAAALLTVPLVAGLITKPPVLLTNSLLRYLGSVSYGWYLWHHTLISLDVVPWLPDAAQDPVAALLGLGVAAVSWRWVERPALRWARAPESPTVAHSTQQPRHAADCSEP
jgi:peptidoglycan/LPS O-acetylase OafA/YrhL